jgi:hypothetical protein
MFTFPSTLISCIVNCHVAQALSESLQSMPRNESCCCRIGKPAKGKVFRVSLVGLCFESDLSCLKA